MASEGGREYLITVTGVIALSFPRGLWPRQDAGDTPNEGDPGDGNLQGQRELPKPPELCPSAALAVLTRQLGPAALGRIPQPAPHEGPWNCCSPAD